MEQKVNFLICGTQKGGTTALADYLRTHPEIFIPNQKELHFFDEESHNWQLNNKLNYHQFFQDSPKGRQWGEATPIYMYWEPSAERIWRYNPSMKLIMILRNPITRAYSHWAMEYNRGAESLGFEAAIKLELERSQESLPLQHRIYSYIDRGFYSNQIKRLWRFFGKESLLILRQEQLKNKPLDCLNQIYSHLKVKEVSDIKSLRSHIGQYSNSMSSEAKLFLRKIFWHEICQLESLLNWDCREWLKP